MSGGVSVQEGICQGVSVRGVHVRGGYVLEPYLTITLQKLPNSISSNFCGDKVEVAYYCLK